MEYYCVYCGIRLKGNKRKYCSNTCKCKQFYKEHPEKCNLWNKKNPKPKVNNKCKTCGKLCGRKKYCSDECKPKRINLPIYWDNQERFNLKCKCCKKIIFNPHMHHINGNYKDNRRENLIILCPSCHLRVHIPHKKDKYKYNNKRRDEIYRKITELHQLLPFTSTHKNIS